MTVARQALFQVICEQPWDDTPRLVYADWLEENGQPQRAAFIRFQCQYPEWDSGHPQYHELSVRDSEFDPFRSEWIKELPILPGVKWWGRWFKRGFVSTVEFSSAKAFREHAATVFTASPVDSAVINRVTDRTVQGILPSPFLSRLRWLCFKGILTDEGVRLVAACPSLTRLESLMIWGGGFGDAGTEAIAGSPYLVSLRCLSFSSHRIGDRGALALAKSPNLDNVTELVLHFAPRVSQAVVKQLKKRFHRLD